MCNRSIDRLASSAKFCGDACRQSAHRRRRSGSGVEHPGDRLAELPFADRIGFADYLDDEGVAETEEIPEPFVIDDLRLTPRQLEEKYGRDVEIELLGWHPTDGMREWLEMWSPQTYKIDPWPHADHWPLHDPDYPAQRGNWRDPITRGAYG